MKNKLEYIQNPVNINPNNIICQVVFPNREKTGITNVAIKTKPKFPEKSASFSFCPLFNLSARNIKNIILEQLIFFNRQYATKSKD